MNIKIRSGKRKDPCRAIIYGPEGVGKTTLAAGLPTPVFIDTERGSNHLDVSRVDGVDTWADVVKAVESLIADPVGFSTLVIDTVDWLEAMAVDHVCKTSGHESIEDFGYGKGYAHLAETFSGLLRRLDLLSQKLNVVLLAHSTIRKFEEPDQAGAYDRYEVKLSKKVGPICKEWSDLMLFANYFTRVTEDKDKRTRAVGGKERRLYTSHTAAYDAKNRHGLPEWIPMEADALKDIFVTRAKPADNGTATAPCASELETLVFQLGLSNAEIEALIKWTGADYIPGAAHWSDMDEAQTAKAVKFLREKLAKKGVAA